MQAAEADKSRPFSRWALALVLLGAVGGPLWLWWTALRHSNINYLPHHSGANWIIYPVAPDLPPRSRLELSTVFTQTFTLPQMPPTATLSVAGFHRYNVELNGKPLGKATHKGRDWKRPDEYEVAALLRTGENQISVTVFNTNGPPALWCSLVAGAGNITGASDETWQASYAGATWHSARLATRTKWVPAGSPGFGEERPLSSIEKRWPALLLFAAISTAVYWFGSRIARKPAKPWLEHLPLFIAMAVWIALFVNNIGVLPPAVGFDFEGHRAYIRYLLEHHALPLASQGWEMYQPPLYYIVSALWLKLLGLSIADQSGLVAIRWLGFAVALMHLAVLWATLRLLFPGRRFQQRSGLTVATAMPPLLYLGHYISNEAPSAALYTCCLYLALRILRNEEPSWKLYVGLGFCLGAAMLAKASAVLLFPPILGALLWHAGRGKRAEGRGQRSQFKAILSQVLRIAAVGAICLAVCGWHYYGMWRRYGNPLIGSWDPKVGFAWWAANGYQTAMHYLRAGTALAYPWFSGLNSVPDGMYSTLWGDSLLGGMAVLIARPPWNYDLMAAGYLLALLPTLAAILGGLAALIKFVEKPTPDGFIPLGLFYLTLFALVSLSLDMPGCALFKAFYGLPALVPFCAFAAIGLSVLSQRSGKLRPVLIVGFCVWALNSYASFWIARSSGPAQVARPWSLFREDRTSEALHLLDLRLEQHPHDGDARWVRALALLKQNNYPQAAEQAEILVREQPTHALGRVALAMALSNEQQVEQALAQSRAAIDVAPGYGMAYECLATLLLQQAKYEDCERVARQGLAVLPFSPELRLALGASLLDGKKDLEADAQLQLAFALNPNWPEGYQRVARALTDRGRFDEAVNSLGNAARLAPKDPQVIFQLATVLARSGQTDGAVASAKRARELAVAAGQRELIQRTDKLLEILAARKTRPN